MWFTSDNASGVAPEILAALAAVNEGGAPAYGADAATARIEGLVREVFEKEVTVFPVATGTAANALALSALASSWGAVYCHKDAHVNVDECGAPEFFSGGAKLVDLPGEHGKLTVETLEAAIFGAGTVHHAQPAAISLTQATEAGTVYTPEEIGAIGALARARGLKLHMDGARFANALVSVGCSPAELTWRAGVDVLCFGATKNGAMAAEAVIFFDRTLAESFGYRRKRAGHLFSKMRFLSVQLEAYLTNGLWLRNAAHANRMAQRLADGLRRLPGVRLLHPVEANEIFAVLPEAVIAGLEADGFKFYRWDGPGTQSVRLVTSFNTEAETVDALLAAAQRHARLPVADEAALPTA